jgi:YidC/Oxa1 family membrane protein insertase
MDKKTFTEFLIFTGIVLVIWWGGSALLLGDQRGQPVAPPQQPAQDAQDAQDGRGPEAPDAQPSVGPSVGVQEPPEASPAEPVDPAQGPEPEPLTRTLSNDLILTEWTNRGAALARLEYLDPHYKAPYFVNGERPNLVLLEDFQDGLYPDSIQTVAFHGGSRFEVPVEDALFELVGEAPDRLVFERTVTDGRGRALLVRKTVTLPPDAYHYEVDLQIRNAGPEQVDFTFALRGATGIEREAVQSRYLGTRVGIRKDENGYKIAKAHAMKLPKEDEVNESADIAWAGVVNHYFVAVTDPENPGWINDVVSKAVTDSQMLRAEGQWSPGSLRDESKRATLARQNAGVVFNSVVQTLQPGESFETAYRLIAAPKKDDLLESYDKGMQGLVEYGLLPAVSRIVLQVLKGVYWLIPNYGIAILVVTAIVRTILHPMTRKMQVGMAKMQKLQPMMQELQKKYADDKQKLTQEQLALWRRYGVNPMGGCWPMFLQLPVLFALFGALRAAIELRHAGFLWIDDLSMPDRLITFSFSLPLIGNEFNILPILSAVAMFFSQKSMSGAATSDQAKQQQAMMKFMPIMLLFFFYRMPSGLTLYFCATMAIGIVERKLVQRKTEKLELKPVAEKAGKAGRRGGTKTSGETWLGKLQRKVEEMERRNRGKSRK